MSDETQGAGSRLSWFRRSKSYALKSDVPKYPGIKAKLCAQCDLWFLAPPRAKNCFSCLPNRRRRERADLLELVLKLSRHTTTRDGLNGDTNPQVKAYAKKLRTARHGANSAGLQLTYEMALEEAFRIDYPYAVMI